MKTIITLSLFALSAYTGLAQTGNYTFIREGGQMGYLDTANPEVTHHTVEDDIVLPAKVKIGFPFRFNGNTYDSLGISENGFIWFGPAQASDLGGITNPITETLPAGVAGIVCAFGIDLHPHVNTGLTTSVLSLRQDFAGSPDNFIIEWRNSSRWDAISDPLGEDTLDFQIQLFAKEADRVQITYGFGMHLNPNITSQLSVGMKGASQTDFALRATDANHTWDNTLAGAALTSTCELSATSNPAAVPHNYMSWVNNNPTGIKDDLISSIFTVYPVPAKDVLYVNQSNAQSPVTSYEIYHMDGKLANAGMYTASGISTSNLNTGVYFVRLQTADGVGVKRFVKE
jgi:hypothetical protein